MIPLGRFFGYYKNRWLDSVGVQDAVYIFDELIQCLLENVTWYYKWNRYTSTQKYTDCHCTRKLGSEAMFTAPQPFEMNEVVSILSWAYDTVFPCHKLFF